MRRLNDADVSVGTKPIEIGIDLLMGKHLRLVWKQISRIFSNVIMMMLGLFIEGFTWISYRFHDLNVHTQLLIPKCKTVVNSRLR